MANSDANRGRNAMYVQSKDLLHDQLNLKNKEDLYDYLSKQEMLEQFAFILHDKDTDEDGNLKYEHYHVALIFKDTTRVGAVKKLFKSDEYAKKHNLKLSDRVTFFNNSAYANNKNNLLAYLIHKTKQAALDGKYQYDIEEVVANFDYKETIHAATLNINKLSRNEIENYIEQYANEEITLEVLENKLGRYNRSTPNIRNKIKNITEDIDKEKYDLHVKMMKEKNIAKDTIYIYGDPRTGKTSLAKELANTYINKYDLTSDDIYITQSTKDRYQDYKYEQVIIEDELRDDSYKPIDLLKILDKYNYNYAAPSRYTDKRLIARTFIMTSIYSPEKLFRKMDSAWDSDGEPTEQLLGRLTMAIRVTKDEYIFEQYNLEKGDFFEIGRKPNKLYEEYRERDTELNKKKILEIMSDI